MARAFSHTHQFTPEEEADIVRRFQSGEAAQKIGASYGLGSGKAVKRVCTERGVFVVNRRFSGRFSTEDRTEIARRYEAGETQKQIASDFGCTPGNIRALLVRMDVFIRPMGVGPIDERSERILRQMREEGHSVEEIAKHLSVPMYRVRRWVSELDLPRPLKVRAARPRAAFDSPRGYRYVYIQMDDPLRVMAHGDGVALEHRIVMARSLGRPLSRTETVHHVNGNRADNRLENLQVRNGHHGPGSAYRCLDCGSHNVRAVPLSDV